MLGFNLNANTPAHGNKLNIDQMNISMDSNVSRVHIAIEHFIPIALDRVVLKFTTIWCRVYPTQFSPDFVYDKLKRL